MKRRRPLAEHPATEAARCPGCGLQVRRNIPLRTLAHQSPLCEFWRAVVAEARPSESFETLEPAEQGVPPGAGPQRAPGAPERADRGGPD